MKNRVYILFLFAISFFITCLNNKDYRFTELKKEIITLNKNNLHDILKKYNIKNPYELRFNETGYYYPVALFFYNKFGYNDWVEHQLNMAVKTNSIFKIEALNFNCRHLIKEKNFEKLKKILKSNEKFLKDNNLTFYQNFINNVSLFDYENLTDNPDFYPLIQYIILNNKSDLNYTKSDILINYIIKSKVYILYKNELFNNLSFLIRNTNNNYFRLLYSYYSKDKKTFNRLTEIIIRNDDNLNFDKAGFIRELSINLGIKKDFYNILKLYYKKNINLTHFYCLDILNYESFKNQIFLFKNIPYADEKNDINYYFKYKILLNTINNLNEGWLIEFSKFLYNYPDKYNSKILIDELFIRAVFQEKTYLLIKNFNKFDISVLSPQIRTIFLYQMYLIDKNEVLNLKELINKEYPWSYASLRINNGIINKNNYIKDSLNNSSDAKYEVFNKIKLLLEFNLSDDALALNITELSDQEQIKINNLFYDYYISQDDYYTALRYSNKNFALDNKNYYKLNNLDLLKRSYPLHYKELVFKYSKEFNVDPALAFAVMREESYFKKDIVSYMNAIGLMQIIPSTGKFIAQKLKLKTYDLKNPDDNIKMGIYYLSFIKNYYTDYSLIAASYNAGKGRVNTWGIYYKKYSKEIMYELIPIYETRHYIRKVMGSYYIYKYLLENEEKYSKK